MGEKVMYLLMLMVVMICGSCNAGEVHKVGDSSGWTSLNITSSYYKSWTTSKVFHVGDTILFEYNKEFHNVVRVTHKNFNACNTTAPYAEWATGNDSFTIRRPGHYYFICGFPGHCWAGQKVDIRVPNQQPAPHRSPSPPPRSTPAEGPASPPPRSPPAEGPASPPSESLGPSVISSSPALPPKKNGASSIKGYLKPSLVAVAIGFAAIAF